MIPHGPLAPLAATLAIMAAIALLGIGTWVVLHARQLAGLMDKGDGQGGVPDLDERQWASVRAVTRRECLWCTDDDPSRPGSVQTWWDQECICTEDCGHEACLWHENDLIRGDQ